MKLDNDRILAVDSLVKYYGAGENLGRAVDHTSLERERGKFTVIVGRSGSGKSTLLHLIGGLDRPDEGKVWIEGKDIFALKDDRLAEFRRKKIGFVFQDFILITSCLLHDIGRKDQFENPSLSHALLGSEKAYSFLTGHGFDTFFAEQVKLCILAHSYRQKTPAQNLEAKILFDADKLDVVGAIGIARTLVYTGTVSKPLYSLLPDGSVSTGEHDITPSFFHEYKHKLSKMYSNFYTARAAELAREREQTAIDFYNHLYQESTFPYRHGREELDRLVR